MKPIPDAALGQHIAVLGKTGSGKTFAVKGIVEQLLADGRRVGIVDPTGAWWGLRSSHDGRGPGFPILVLGGDHGDLPLPALGGAAVARLLVEQNVNLVADTSQLTVGERTRWFIDFATTLHRLNRSPLHLVMDEAHMFAPQGKVPDPDTGKMLHAANTLASGGRSRGIRLAMITQRPQKLHKDALTSADTLIAMRVLAPQDRLAVEDWIKGCGDMAAGKEVLNSLASLKRGEGWVWYPEGGHLARVKFPPITTFDSSATPTDGHAIATPRGGAELDLSEIKSALADAVKEAEANDPKLLRARIAELEREARKPGATQIDPAALTTAEQRGYQRGRVEGANEAAGALRALAQPWDSIEHAMAAMGRAIRESCQIVAESANRPQNIPEIFPPAVKHPVQFHASPPGVKSGTNGAISKAGRLILTALAQHRPEPLDQDRLAILAGYAVGTGHFNNTVGAMRSQGYMTKGWPVEITQAGLNALGEFEPLPTGKALLEYWCGRLGKAERLILLAGAEAYPNALTKAQLANRAGYEADTGHFNNSLGRLRTMRLLKGRSEIRLSENLA